MTIREFLFGPTPTITPSIAARALGAERRRADREKIAAMTARLRAGIERGEVAQLGWRG